MPVVKNSDPFTFPGDGSKLVPGAEYIITSYNGDLVVNEQWTDANGDHSEQVGTIAAGTPMRYCGPATSFSLNPANSSVLYAVTRVAQR